MHGLRLRPTRRAATDPTCGGDELGAKIRKLKVRTDVGVTICYRADDDREADAMTTTSTPKPRRDTLNLRIPAAERNLIDRAAASVGKTRTTFILEAARRAETSRPGRAAHAWGAGW